MSTSTIHAYVTLCGAKLPRTQVTSRLRRDAAVYDLTPPRTGRRGRPHKKGDRLPSPTVLAAAATDWTRVTYNQRGTPSTGWCGPGVGRQVV